MRRFKLVANYEQLDKSKFEPDELTILDLLHKTQDKWQEATTKGMIQDLGFVMKKVIITKDAMDEMYDFFLQEGILEIVCPNGGKCRRCGMCNSVTDWFDERRK